MWPNPQFSADLVTFTEEILTRKLHFLCRENSDLIYYTVNLMTHIFKIMVKYRWKIIAVYRLVGTEL